MKKLKKHIIPFIVMFLAVYLLGAFYSISFDISKWTQMTRFLVVIFGGLISFLTSPLLSEDENK
jgi:uncharacterized membrane protein YqhA